LLSYVVPRLAASPVWRYRLRELVNADAFAPLVAVVSDRVPAGLRALEAAGYAPDLVIDVGAYEGEWTRQALPHFPTARFLLIEAQPSKEAILRAMHDGARDRVAYEIALLGAVPKPATDFYLGETGSTLYPEQTAVGMQSVRLPMTTLDALLARREMPGRVFLKMDVQGAELDVLAGAHSVLPRIDVILLEASVVAYNAGAPRVAEVIAQLRELDFLLYDIWDLRRIDSVLAQVDLVFARRGSAVEAAAAETIRRFDPKPQKAPPSAAGASIHRTTNAEVIGSNRSTDGKHIQNLDTGI
jgi:FkbM family methyltransferase